MRFYIGLHQPSDARHFDMCMVSVNRLWERVSDFPVRRWIMDAGAFSEVKNHGDYRRPVWEYAERIVRFATCGDFEAAVTRDYMCEDFILAKWGRTVAQHQAWTIERYDELRALVPGHIHVMPVLQGGAGCAEDYVRHLHSYGDRLTPGMWVGVGSVCKLNAKPSVVERVLWAIHRARPDLRLHGFGVKVTALRSGLVRGLLHSADSMAWSHHARMNNRNANDWREAAQYVGAVAGQQYQPDLFAAGAA